LKFVLIGAEEEEDKEERAGITKQGGHKIHQISDPSFFFNS
jgi:hypothetical protein